MMNDEKQKLLDKMWDATVDSSQKSQAKLRKRKTKDNLLSWLKEHGVELLALIVAIIALIRTF